MFLLLLYLILMQRCLNNWNASQTIHIVIVNKEKFYICCVKDIFKVIFVTKCINLLPAYFLFSYLKDISVCMLMSVTKKDKSPRWLKSPWRLCWTNWCRSIVDLRKMTHYECMGKKFQHVTVKPCRDTEQCFLYTTGWQWWCL